MAENISSLISAQYIKICILTTNTKNNYLSRYIFTLSETKTKGWSDMAGIGVYDPGARSDMAGISVYDPGARALHFS